ncbi:tripartite tricarboxylate transporter TctB family protein [Cognatishimia maritima]|uniref:Tripartite tricarboxylate transporter TctB family protein n=1 Tax=Cognatishimia maritima TaxID=870908 RepID=A0A1M5QP08_9RHOB|nr:tripartite tricarboxylate transporter TctB family protein [Cognatishimia maritima]SHH15611.1 Tripartite tricarboxylate transporter TctB family protein [Cognatishimia maritima]
MLNMKTADLVFGLILVMLGCALTWGGFTMDRLEVRRIHPASIPGLVPMGLGLLIALSGVLLVATNMKVRASEIISVQKPGLLFQMLVICLFYALVMLGRIPFFWATSIFIAIATFRLGSDAAETETSRGPLMIKAVLFGLVMSAAISALFRYAFLVRLP